MPVVGASFDQVGEHQLGQRRTGGVSVPLGVAQSVSDLLRRRDPAEPQRGRQRVRGGARIGDGARRHPLHGADRLAVVAEFAVVVVLDDQPAGGARPRGQCSAPVWVQGRTSWILMRRSYHHRVGSGVSSGVKQIGAGAEHINRQRDHPQARAADDLAMVRVPWILHRYRAGALLRQHRGEQS